MPPTYVEGAQETVRGMQKASDDLKDLTTMMRGVAAEAITIMQRFIPARSGRLKASLRETPAHDRAVITIGRGNVPYAGPINYGWRTRNIRPANFVAKTDLVMEQKLNELLGAGWNGIATKHGLG